MNIGFDAKRLFHNRTGLGNYSRETVRLMAEKYPQNEHYLYTQKPAGEIDVTFLTNQNNIHVRLPGKDAPRFVWRSKYIVKDMIRDGIDLYHGLSNELPLGIRSAGTASVVTIHDLIFRRFPQYYHPIDRFLYDLKARYACANADRIIAVSERTKADIVHYYGTGSNRIDVVYQGCDASFSREKTAAEKAGVALKYQLPDNFLLSVGTIEERKNLELIIRAMPQVDPEIKLVVAGRPTAYLKKIRKLIDERNLQHRILFLHTVSFVELPALYQLARIFIYPSRYEGFGIPIVEALSSGTPVIAATGSCLEEAGGPDSSYVDPDDEKALAKSIASILSNGDLQKKMTQNGLRYVSRFSDDEIAGNLMACYQKARVK